MTTKSSTPVKPDGTVHVVYENKAREVPHINGQSVGIVLGNYFGAAVPKRVNIKVDLQPATIYTRVNAGSRIDVATVSVGA